MKLFIGQLHNAVNTNDWDFDILFPASTEEGALRKTVAHLFQWCENLESPDLMEMLEKIQTKEELTEWCKEYFSTFSFQIESGEI